MKVKDLISEGKKFNISKTSYLVEYDGIWYERIFFIEGNEVNWYRLMDDGDFCIVSDEMHEILESLCRCTKEDKYDKIKF